MANLFGGGNKAADKANALAKQNAEQQQRRTLAELARQQAEVDQASAGPTGRKNGGQLLTFLTGLSGEGPNKFGQV